jgi:hypothetical protein
MEAYLTLETTDGKRCLAQLARHFQAVHHLPVDLAIDHVLAHVTLPSGSCGLAADGSRLVLTLKTRQEAMPAMQNFVARHLVRFQFCEEEDLAWDHVIA